jgi:hypothetical protein
MQTCMFVTRVGNISSAPRDRANAISVTKPVRSESGRLFQVAGVCLFRHLGPRGVSRRQDGNVSTFVWYQIPFLSTRALWSMRVYFIFIYYFLSIIYALRCQYLLLCVSVFWLCDDCNGTKYDRTFPSCMDCVLLKLVSLCQMAETFRFLKPPQAFLNHVSYTIL